MCSLGEGDFILDYVVCMVKKQIDNSIFVSFVFPVKITQNMNLMDDCVTVLVTCVVCHVVRESRAEV